MWFLYLFRVYCNSTFLYSSDCPGANDDPLVLASPVLELQLDASLPTLGTIKLELQTYEGSEIVAYVK